MDILETYIGASPFTVLIDDSPHLRDLAGRARELIDLPFLEKMEAVKELATGAMTNAYEQMIVWSRTARSLEGLTVIGSDGQADSTEYDNAQKEATRFRDIVFQGHPLSYALEQEAGCCRYQGALFFALGFEADLGNRHFVQAAPVNPQANTVFNDVVHGDELYQVSIFTESLDDKALDYSVQNPHIFDQAFQSYPGMTMYSYHRTPNGLVIAANPTSHVLEL